LIIGIDNGLHGAVVALSEVDGAIIGWFDTPTVAIKKTRFQLAPAAMVNLLRGLVDTEKRCMAFVEKGAPIGTDGVISNWHNGASYAGWRCLLVALEIPYEEVVASTWQRAMLKGVPGDSTKAKSLHRAQGLFPSLPLMSSDRAKSINMDGRADAALIAEYGRRRLKGAE